MKRFFNVCAILLAICLAASFVSCKNNDDDDDDSSVVAGDSSVVAVYTYSDGHDTETLTFYDDNTVTSVIIFEGGQTDSKTGTWKGNLSEGGTISIRNGTYDFSVSGTGNTMTYIGNEFTKQ